MHGPDRIATTHCGRRSVRKRSHSRSAFNGILEVPCAVRRVPTSFTDAQINHAPSHTVRRLVTEWLAAKGPTLGEITINPRQDNQFVAEMVARAQRTS